MAVSTYNYFNNAVNGIISVGADFNKFDKHVTPRYAVGTHFYRSDGAVFVYSHFGADTNRGVLVSQDIDESSYVDTDNVVIAPSSTYKVDSEPGNIYPGSIGSHYVVITLASITVNQFAGGYFVPTDGTGIGYTHRIVGNTATDDPASGLIRLQLAEPIQVALAADTDFAICGSPYANLEIATAATDVHIAGVTCSTMDVSVAPYGFVQKKGIVGVLTDGSTIAVGDMVNLSDDTSGAIQAVGGNGTLLADLIAESPILGTCIVLGDSAGMSVIDLTGL